MGKPWPAPGEYGLVKLRDVSKPMASDRYVFLKEGWCHFDPKTEELIWNPPRGNLYRSDQIPFRNVPPNSSLGVLQNPGLTEEERNWQLYLNALKG